MSQPARAPLRVLHCHSTFSAGGKEVRSVGLMNAFGAALEHSIVSAEPEAMGARALIDRGVKVRFPENFPSLKGLPTPGRLVKLAGALKGYDLICTYNWGAIDVAMAHTVFGRSFGLPPLVHHEDGFNEDEAAGLLTRRNLYRQAALRGAARVIVPSAGLENIARGAWAQPADKVLRIANGIDTAAFAAPPDPGALRLIKREGERWIGTLAGLRPVKQLPMLVEAMAGLPEEWHLVICGDGPEREAIAAAAEALDVSHRVHLPGAISNPAQVTGLFDIFALSSASEQFPLSVVEAMAAGLPVAAPDVGDVREMVAEPNRAYIAVPGDPQALGVMLADLAGDAALRQRLGEANRARARALYDAADMIARYRAAYGQAMGCDF
ncbi:glycosyltransferase family 4 protein [Erythrobacter dokdonensis]|uniref:Glycosyl transferase n=1 Tax=Erythrobacter dokdonensis DSW-74 TaxID=1300349 RepID=A0A1A7BK29_9SPHN|nr:glycosyltransferase family 4 protein [Erythrobacter dokdonensis]OBV11540.1 Glycosyl transferase [Erythrobacter dokdonensis DSW-74]